MGVPISNVTRRVVYVASGTGPYNFTFEILAATDIAVYRDDTLLTLTTDYSVTINSNGTGYVTLVATPTGATQIAIVGNRTIQRTTDFVTGGDFFANTINDEMDQQTIFAQQNAESIQRALIAPQTDPTSILMTLPRSSVRAGKYLGFDASGNVMVDGSIPDVQYYGALASDPATRPNATARQVGDLYLNTTEGQIKVWNGTVWKGVFYPVAFAVPASAVDCRNGSYFTKTVAGNTTFTFTNAPTGLAYAFTLRVTHSSGTITWPASVKWPGNAAPSLTTSRIHLFTFVTEDAGTSWYGSYLANYPS
jgi:hypothetical protein